jgi:Probable zinc-ribbon domain
MKSGKQRRAEIIAARAKRIEKQRVTTKMQEQRLRPTLGPPVNEELLAPNNSYGAPDFVRRGYYVDRPFKCVDCGTEEIWTGAQQKWWYEVAKGFAYSTAVRCRLCRRKERARRETARRAHLEGIARKEQARAPKRTEKNK